MIGCLRTRVRKQPIIALYFESETVLKLYNLEAGLSFSPACQCETNNGLCKNTVYSEDGESLPTVIYINPFAPC